MTPVDPVDVNISALGSFLFKFSSSLNKIPQARHTQSIHTAHMVLSLRLLAPLLRCLKIRQQVLFFAFLSFFNPPFLFPFLRRLVTLPLFLIPFFFLDFLSYIHIHQQYSWLPHSRFSLQEADLEVSPWLCS